MNGAESVPEPPPPPASVRRIVIDSEEEGSSNPDSPSKTIPHFDHDYGSALGARLNTALEYYGDGVNNETFPLMEGLESVYNNDVSPSAPSTSRADPRATYIAEQMTPKTVHLSKMPTKPYSDSRRPAFPPSRSPRTPAMVVRPLDRPQQSFLKFTGPSPTSRPLQRQYVSQGPEMQPLSRTPGLLRTSAPRPRIPPPPRPVPNRLKQFAQPNSPENAGLMNVLAEEDAQNQKFFQKHQKFGSNVPQMKPIVPVFNSTSPLKISDDYASKPRGRGRPSNAEKAAQQHVTHPVLNSQSPLKNGPPSADRKKLENLAELAQQQLASPPKPALPPPIVVERSPMKPLPSEITEIAEVLSHHLPSAPKVERPKRQKKSRQDSIEDEDGVEGVDYITRCFCELKHNDPSMVQCDQCKAWQHLNCFGGANVVNTEGEFFCHVCKPRKLPLTKDEAQDLQKLFLNGSQKPKKKQKSLDKSLSSQKLTPAQVTARKLQKAAKRTKKYESINDSVLSRKLKNVISDLPEGDLESFVTLKTVGDSRCKNMAVAPQVDGLVTTNAVKKGEPLIEFKGYLWFVDEEKVSEKMGQPSVFYHSIVYNELGGDFAAIFADGSKQGSMARDARRSCRPNAKINHCVADNKLRLFLVATEDIDNANEITLPFDCELRGNPEILLECACVTDLAYSADKKSCLIENYNKAVRNGTLEKATQRPSPLRKRTTSPEKHASPPKSPRRLAVKEPKSPAAKPQASPKRTVDVENKTSSVFKEEPSTSTEVPKEEKDDDVVRRSSRKRTLTNDTSSSGPPSKLRVSAHKKRSEDLKMDVKFSTDSHISREDRKNQKAMQIFQNLEKQNGRRKSSDVNEKVEPKPSRRRDSEKAAVVKEPKAESPVEFANLLLGLSKTETTKFSWKEFRNKLGKTDFCYPLTNLVDSNRRSTTITRRNGRVPQTQEACLESVSPLPIKASTLTPHPLKQSSSSPVFSLGLDDTKTAIEPEVSPELVLQTISFDEAFSLLANDSSENSVPCPKSESEEMKDLDTTSNTVCGLPDLDWSMLSQKVSPNKSINTDNESKHNISIQSSQFSVSRTNPTPKPSSSTPFKREPMVKKLPSSTVKATPTRKRRILSDKEINENLAILNNMPLKKRISYQLLHHAASAPSVNFPFLSRTDSFPSYLNRSSPQFNQDRTPLQSPYFKHSNAFH